MKKLAFCRLFAAGFLAAAYIVHAQFIPGDPASAGSSYIVPDVAIWYNTNQLPGHPFPGYVTNGPVKVADQLGNLDLNNGNWDQNVSVVGDSTFLIGASTFADDGSWNGSTNAINQGVVGNNMRPNQTHIVVVQAAAGGAGKLDSAYYDDSGAPYRLHTSCRQRNGGPSVAGDRRFGAANFVTKAMASFWYCKLWFGIDYFNSDGRFSTNYPLFNTGFPSGCNQDCENIPWPGYLTPPTGIDDVQMGVIQTFSLNPTTQARSKLSNAQPSAYDLSHAANVPVCVCNNITNNGGSSTCANGQGGDNWLGYEGGVAVLDNGNFVSMVGDPTGFFGGALGTHVGVVTVFRPDGTVVKPTFLVDSTADRMVQNTVAFSGGFCIRFHGNFYFYDNAGNLLHTSTVASSGIAFATDRGGSTRLAADIRSHYVYLAGPVGSVVQLGIWDARTGTFVTNAVVSSDLDPSATVGNTDVAADSQDRICVAFEGKPATSFPVNQVIARVLKFDGATIQYLTPSFFPFVNADNAANVAAHGLLGFQTINPSVAMTLRQICIAAKGTINSANNPANGPDTPSETTVYTVITHPVPLAAPRPTITLIPWAYNIAFISWVANAGLFRLQSTPALSPTTWADVDPQPETVGPSGGNYFMPILVGGGNNFFRLTR
jgi:hypothetical protein